MLRPLSLALCLLPAPLLADEIEEALTAALEAYQAGDTTFALEELDFARVKLQELKADALFGFLPPAPAGWRQELDTEVGATMGMMGGGAGAAASYYPEGGGSAVTITLMADNPMVAGMAAMVANAGAMGASIERVNRQQFAVQDDQMIAMVANRVLVQAEGGGPDVLMPFLEAMDFRALASWGL
ncbi:MAG: hypothetical protein AAFP13_16260 [Pseudomonadota bacterium]